MRRDQNPPPHRLTLPPPSISHTPSTAHISPFRVAIPRNQQSDCPAQSGLKPSVANATSLHALQSSYLALSGHCLPPAVFSASSAICIKCILLSPPHQPCFAMPLERIITWRARRYYAKWAIDQATLQCSRFCAIMLSLGRRHALDVDRWGPVREPTGRCVRCRCRYLWDDLPFALPCVHTAWDVAADRTNPCISISMLSPSLHAHLPYPKLPDVIIPTRHLQEILIVS